DVLMVEQAPHDWLFSRVDAVVHHGGAGTVAAAAASGRPQVICPFLGDQPFWARQARIAGIAPEPIPQRRLASDRLASAIRETLDRRADTAAKLGELIRAEDGTGNAIQELDRLCRAAR
ncbi:MAG: glycosyltransferase, partial [Pseudonocardiaceae bacterium]|nr:glycosyltransferase [Pseudonocardiaceae bacterium]